MYNLLRSAVGLLFITVSLCFADTFVHRQTGEILHGYATQETVGGKTLVHTRRKGQQYLNLADYEVQADHLGRNNKVILVSITEGILLEIETKAVENAIVTASNEGPLFILLEIDTPGGRVDLAKQICAAITKTDNCLVIAYITGGKYGGALSAGAAIALACDRVYMADNAAIGAATLVVGSASGPKELRKVLDETVSEKLMSAWRGYLASLAEQNNRPGLVAMAMVDKDIEVVEVNDHGKRFFIQPVNRRPAQAIVRTWSSKGSLVTLTASDAVKCNIADKVLPSQEQLLVELNAASAEVVRERSPQEARKKFKKAMARFEKLIASVDYHHKQLKEVKITSRQLEILRNIISDYKNLIRVAESYPDVPASVHALQEELNSVQAVYDGARMRQ